MVEGTKSMGKTQKQGMSKKKRNDLLFYMCLVVIPFAQFCIFYVGVNFNSILLAFQRYENGGYIFDGLRNFKRIFSELTGSSTLLTAFKNSVILYAAGLLLGVTLSLLFSFYISKKLPGGNFFKVILFMPSIISAMVMVIVFKYFMEEAIPGIVFKITGKKIAGLLSRPNSLFYVHMFYSLWVGFGVSTLMYVGAMGNISDSIVESARLEGVSILQEFWHITLPLIYPTITTFVVVGVAGLFTNQMHLYSFYGQGASTSIQTLGYYLFKDLIGEASVREYPYLAALGLVFTLVAAPITFAVKYLMEKFGPSIG